MKLPLQMQSGESVVQVIRRHPVYLIAKLTGIVLVALIPVALLIWLLAATAGFGGAVGGAVIVACIVWVLVWAATGFLAWYAHHNDLWVITDQRLLDLRKQGLFDQSLSSADLVNVQDISIAKDGILGSVLDFGDVRCQTAGAESAFVLTGIPHPAAVLTTLDAARDAARMEGRVRDDERLPSDAVPGPATQAQATNDDRVPGARRNPTAPS